MRIIHTYWKFLARDYLRLMLDDRWYWCRRCRRPVEHALLPVSGSDPERKALTCLDCNYADPGAVESPRGHDANTKPRHIG